MSPSAQPIRSCAVRSGRLWLAAGLAAASVAGCAAPSGPRPALSVSGGVCADVSFPIYFATGSDQLSDPAQQAVVAGAARVRGCPIREVDVFGLADTDGAASANLELSRRRASVVARALAASGLPGPLFDVKGLGESGARTASGGPALLQRKTEVVIRVGARA